MARRGYSTDADGEDDVNVTPLLDIVFIMLIFFIVTSTFVKEPGEEVIRPDAQTASDKSVNILVAITADDRIFIDKQELEIAEVRVAVAQLLRENPRASVAVIQADEESTARFLVETMEQIRAAGVPNVAVATKPS